MILTAKSLSILALGPAIMACGSREQPAGKPLGVETRCQAITRVAPGVPAGARIAITRGD